jgi:hypothetical protein
MQLRALVATVVAAPALGVVLGVRGVFPFGRLVPAADFTPLARVGYALREGNRPLTADDSTVLGRDLVTVRVTWPGEVEALNLVVALRGLENAGNTEWVRAEASCRALRWPRCDRPALEELRKRSRP